MIEQLAVRGPITRSLGTLTVNLFEEYPENFPAQASSTELVLPLESWFRVDRVRITRIQPPDGSGPLIQYSRNGLTIRRTLTKGAERFGLDLAVEFIGRMDEELPIGLAANCSVYVSGHQQPILAFPFVFGRGLTGFEESQLDGRLDELRINRSHLTVTSEVLPTVIKDGIIPGRLHLMPVRSLALGAGRFDRYIGDKISMPIKVEIVTIDGEWKEEDDP